MKTKVIAWIALGLTVVALSLAVTTFLQDQRPGTFARSPLLVQSSDDTGGGNGSCAISAVFDKGDGTYYYNNSNSNTSFGHCVGLRKVCLKNFGGATGFVACVGTFDGNGF